jgi:heme exporter protein A
MRRDGSCGSRPAPMAYSTSADAAPRGATGAEDNQHTPTGVAIMRAPRTAAHGPLTKQSSLNDSPPTAVLQLERLTCERDGRVLFEGLDFALHRGQIVALKGPNGSGKSTLLRSIAGLTTEYEGNVSRTASFLFQGHRLGLSPLLTALENLHWYVTLHGMGCSESDLSAALAEIGLAGCEAMPCQYLSAGQQRRILLAALHTCVQHGGPQLWLLDEPLTALDVEGCAQVRRLLRAHAVQGGAALCATHQPLDIDGVHELSLGRAA